MLQPVFVHDRRPIPLTWSFPMRHPRFACVLIFFALAAAGCISHDRNWRQTAIEEEGSGSARIAVVDISGPIRFGGGRFSEGGGMEEVCRQLRMAEQDDAVKAVVVTLDTPGGDVVASDAVHARLLALRAKGKPVVALQRSICASGGYYISCAADTVLCGKGTMTGSIGVIFMSPEIMGLAAKIGVGMNVIASGPRKDMGSMFRPMKDEERALIQAMTDQLYAEFLTVVVQGRKGRGPVPADAAAAEAKLRPLADGRVYTGEQALALGLVDGFGHLPEALAEARRLTKLKEATVFRYERSSMAFGFIADAQTHPPQVVNGLNLNVGDLTKFLQPGMAFLWTGN